jgi:hypothetical protein
MESEKYIGPKRVIGITKEDVLTPGGNKVVTVIYDGDYKEIMPLKSYELLVSPTPIQDLRAIQNIKINTILSELLKIVAEYDLKDSEVVPLCQALGNSLNESFNRAANYLWSKDDKRYVAGYDMTRERSILEADIILRSINSDGEKAR